MMNTIEKDAEKDNKPKVTLDTILVNEIGQFGKFQLRAVGLAAIVSIFAAWAAFEYVFTTARISTRCKIPECDSLQPEWSPNWLPNAIPATSSRTFDNCRRYGNTSAVLQQVSNDTCPSTLFDRNVVQLCDEYVYENINSVVYDFELACDEWRRALIGTVRTVGNVAAFPLAGYVSDRWGRRVALILSAFNMCWLGIVRYWTNTYIGFILSELIETMLSGGSFPSCYILLIELLGPKYRVAGGITMNIFVSFGQVIMALIACGVPNWRHLTLALYIPQIISITYFWLTTESVRWYMSKGRFDDAEVVLKKVAKVNGRPLSEKSLQALCDTALEEAKIKALEDESKDHEPWLIVQVFKHKRILLRCIITPLWWITNTFIYYGLAVNAVNITGNMYLNYMAVAAVEVPGFLTAFVLLSRIGRKAVLIGAFWVCAVCQIAYIFIPRGKSCKNRWRNIKDTYYRQKKKNKNGTGSAAHPRCKFQSYRLQLSFLDSVPRERPSISNVDDEHSQASSAVLSPGPSHEVDYPGPIDVMLDTENSASNQTLQSPTVTEDSSIGTTEQNLNQPFVAITRKRSCKKKDDILMFLQKRDEARQKLMQNLSSLSSKRCDGDDEIDLFTRQANTILRKLPSYYQIKAMQELFETLTKYKILAVQTPSGIMHSPNPSSSTSEPRPESAESTYHAMDSPTNTTNYNLTITSEASHNDYSSLSSASTAQEQPADLSLIGMQDLLFNHDN